MRSNLRPTRRGESFVSSAGTSTTRSSDISSRCTDTMPSSHGSWRKVWRTLWSRGIQHDSRLSRLQAVEHEAFGLAIVADHAGVRVPHNWRLWGAPRRSVVPHLVSRHRHRLTRSDPADLTDELLAGDVGAGRSHAEGVIEQRLSGYVGSPGRPGWAGHRRFRPRFPLRMIPIRLPTSLSYLRLRSPCWLERKGQPRTALAGLGPGRLVAVLPYLQVPAVRPPLGDSRRSPRT